MPTLRPDLEPAWSAYATLSPSRSPAGAIPLSEIGAYLDIHAIDDVVEREALLRLVKAMDQEFLAWQAKRRDTAERRAEMARSRIKIS